MTISPWVPLFLAVPVLMLGEWLVRRVRLLHRFNIPPPVVGGLVVSVLVLLVNVATPGTLQLGTRVTAQWWTWLVTIEPEWVNAPARPVSFPMMAAFFTCIGLNASWSVVRRGSVQLVVFLLLATVLAAVQSGAGAGVARLLGENPLLGLVCGSVSMTGGHGTALGFARNFEEMGLAGASVLGAAAATVGLVCGGLLGGPVGGRLIRRLGRGPLVADRVLEQAGVGPGAPSGILHDFRVAARFGRALAAHVLLVMVCLKLGAWVSHFIQLTGISFTAQIGAMIVGVVIRNALDLTGRHWIRSEVVDAIASISLGFFLAIAMMTLNLIELANTAVPMLVILAVQVALMAVFATYVTFYVMGRDYEAAVMAGGHCGFGLGATPNAVANMQSLVAKFGAAPRAFLVVPVVGAILIDFTNPLVITFFMNVVR
jgi:glutamate:Na+ symporter, ESS family